jgi:hypothetical protein
MRRQLLTATLGILVAISSASAITATTDPADLGTVQPKALIGDVPATTAATSLPLADWPTALGWSSSPGFAGPLYLSENGSMVINLTDAPTAFGFWLQPRGFQEPGSTYSLIYTGYSVDTGADPEVGGLLLEPGDGDFPETFFLGFTDVMGIHSVSLSLLPDDPQTAQDMGLAMGDFRIPGTQDDQDVIPEPMTMALAGLSLAGLGGYVRRRRRDA